MSDRPWLPCQFIRPVGSRSCVIRVDATGATLQIGLLEPLNMSKACMITPLKPIAARIRLGEAGFNECELHINWPEPVQDMPPPLRFQRMSKSAPGQKSKRRKV
jgi:hypothetical protein